MGAVLKMALEFWISQRDLKFERTKCWSMGGVNTQRRNFALYFWYSATQQPEIGSSLLEYFSTTNCNDGVNNKIHINIWHEKQPCSGRQQCINSCIICIEMLNMIHWIFEFRDKIMCPIGIDISRKYKFGLNYVHKWLNYSTQRVQKTNINPIKCIKWMFKNSHPLLVYITV